MPSENKDLRIGLNVNIKTIQKKYIYYHIVLKWMDLLETSYLCSYLVLGQCNSVVPRTGRTTKMLELALSAGYIVALFHSLWATLYLSNYTWWGCVWFWGFFWVWFFLGGGAWGGAGGRRIAELKVKISQQSFKDMPTQKNGSEEDT